MKWRIFADSSVPRYILIICLLTTSLSLLPLFAQDMEFSFEPEELYLPIFINGMNAGEINTLPMEELDTKVDVQQLVTLLGTKVPEDKLEELSSHPDQWISIEELQAYPFMVVFNMFDLVVEVIISPEDTIAKRLSLLGTTDTIDYPLLEPADFSFYMNIYASLLLKAVDQFSSGTSQSFAPLNLTLYPVANYKGWSLDTQLRYSTDELQNLGMGDIHIIRDWPELPLKLMLGDISYNTVENQGSPAYVGAVISRELGRSFDAKRYSNYTRSLLVPEDNALVSVLINNRRIKGATLDAGMYTVTDFYFTGGINDVAFQVETADEVTVEEFLFSYDSSLMPPGQTEYVFGVGFPKDESLTLPQLFGNQIFGVNDHVSGNYFFQASSFQQNIGFSTTASILLGNFKLGTALSRIAADNSYGMYTTLAYSYSRVTSPVNRSLSFTAGRYSPNYSLFSSGDPGTSTERSDEWDFSLSYGQSLFKVMGIGIGARMNLDRDEQITATSLTASLRARPARSLSISSSFRIASNGEELTPSASISFSYSPSDKDYGLSYSQDLIEGSNGFSLSYAPEQLKGISTFSLSASDMTFSDPFPNSFTFSSNYRHKDFLLNGDLAIRRTEQEVSYATEFRMNTAVSYAEGLFGISHPIGDSFVLFDTKEEYEGYVLGANPSGGTYLARTDEFGAGVITGLSSFATQNISISAIEIPEGFEMGADKFTFRPTYHQGATIKFSVDSNVTVIGSMHFSDGTPVALYSGEVRKLDAEITENTEPNYFFTYTDGMYELYGLSSGEYVVTLYMGDGLEFSLTVPEGLTGELYTKELIIPVKYKDF